MLEIKGNESHFIYLDLNERNAAAQSLFQLYLFTMFTICATAFKFEFKLNYCRPVFDRTIL